MSHRAGGSNAGATRISDTGTATATSVFHPDLHAGFSEAQKEFSPTPLWWWSGDRVTSERLRDQLDSLGAAGVHNMVVINLAPNGPNRGALADDPPLFSEPWWDLWSGLVEHAERVGARLWFYDQLGFSSANLQGQLIVDHPEHAGAALDRLTVDVQPKASETLTCSGLGNAISASAVELDDTGAPVGTPLAVPVSDECVTWTAPDSSRSVYRLSLIFSRPHGYDYLSPKACLDLLDVVHGEFERRLGDHLGTTIAGSFQDEFPSVPTWSRDFAVEFQRRAGYPLEPVVIALFEDVQEVTGGSTPAQVRLDYQRVRAALAEEAFFRPLHDWHERHGMLVGCDQQGEARAAEPLDTVRQYADYLRTHRWFSAPGSDHHGDAKVHSSLVHHGGGERVWIEAFHSSGWGSTLEETFDWLVPWLLAGATLYNPHAVYYSTRGGWFEWAPPSNCWRQPYWQHYHLFADTVSRLSWLLSRGRHRCEVGVVYPTATVQANSLMNEHLIDAVRAQDCYIRLSGRLVWFRPELGVLPGAGADFDVLDDITVAEAVINNGLLTTGAESYRALLVPESSVVPAATAEQLLTFALSGGIVIIIGTLPHESDTDSGRAVCERLRELVAQGVVHRVDQAEDAVHWLPRADVHVDEGITLRRQIGDREVLVVPAAPTGSATRQPTVRHGKSWRDHLDEHGYDFDPRRWRERSSVILPADADEIEQWDPYSGSARPVPFTLRADGVEVEIDFSSSPLAVVVWRSNPAARSRPADEPSTHEDSGGSTKIELGELWAASLVPTTDNANGDFAWPARPGPLPVQHRRLEYADPKSGEWVDVLVGHGTWAWRTRPLPDDALPPRLQPNHIGPLHGPDWVPVSYSLTRGIEKDPMYVRTLGPNGRVPEEFWQVDHVDSGEAVVFRTRLPIPAIEGSPESSGLFLAVGANADVEVWWNGGRLTSGTDPNGYLRMFALPPSSLRDLNSVEIIAYATEPGPLRGYWAVTRDAPAFSRPEWLAAPDDRQAPVTFQHTFELDRNVDSAVIQLSSIGSATMTLNGGLVGTHGSYEPYGRRHRVQPYDVTRQLRIGTNVIEVQFDPIGTAALLIDALITYDDGSQLVVGTNSAWTLITETGEPVVAAVERRRLVDPRFVQLFGRPHPLPRSRWLNDDCPPGGVLDLTPQAIEPVPTAELRFRTLVPPGARSVTVPSVSGEVRISIDGTPCSGQTGVIELPDPTKIGRQLQLVVRPDNGADAGAVWRSPLTYDCIDGTMRTGDWEAQGLQGYAGGVVYRQEVGLPSHTSALLDLGTVRGTATVSINGHAAGTRIWSPYRFDLSRHARVGTNVIEVTVLNTLASYLDDASPTLMVYPGQRRAGLFGPVHISITPAHDPRSNHD